MPYEEGDEYTIDRSQINIQKFMEDMRMLGEQINNKELSKPAFNYGQLEITNYLLWNLIGELQILNDNVKDNMDIFEEEFVEEEEESA